MRILLYGMQSSGASLVTYFLGQAPRSVALVDVWIRHLTPPLPSAGASHVIAKCTLSTQFDFEQHAERFRPDRTVLVLRHPVQNYASLQHKGYIAEGGAIDEKFSKLEEVFREREQFDLTLAYEDFVARPAQAVEALREVGIPAKLDHYRFRRSTRKIKAFNFAHDPWCRQRYGFGWGFGNVQGSRLNPAKLYRPVDPELEERVRALCPSVCAYYDEHHSELSATASLATTAVEAGSTKGWTSYFRHFAAFGASSADNS